MQHPDYEYFMKRALELAHRAYESDEVPIGALIVFENEIIAKAFNQKESRPSALAHAEVMAIEEASKKLGRWRLSGCLLFTTLEPCVMCSGAILQSRIDKVVYGADDPKGGGQSLFQLLNHPRLNHHPEIVPGILKEDCGQLISKFFQEKRKPS